MTRPWRFLLLLAILSPFAILLMFDLLIRESPKPRPTPEPRAAPFRLCPDVRVDRLPQGLVLRDRDLRNLGENVMGRSIQYQGGAQRVWVAVGYEVLGALEDLDFTDESVQVVRGRRVKITTTDIISAHRIRAGVWEDARFESPCDEFTVVTWNLPRRAFLDVVGGVSIVSGESSQGGIG
jgi:hypothetical protein